MSLVKSLVKPLEVTSVISHELTSYRRFKPLISRLRIIIILGQYILKHEV